MSAVPRPSWYESFIEVPDFYIPMFVHWYNTVPHRRDLYEKSSMIRLMEHCKGVQSSKRCCTDQGPEVGFIGKEGEEIE